MKRILEELKKNDNKDSKNKKTLTVLNHIDKVIDIDIE